MLVLGLTIATLVACGSGDDVYLPSLQADPMAEWSPAAGELRQRSEIAYDEGGSGGKQQLASVTRTFRFESPVDVASAQQDGLARAREEAGWGADSLGREGFLQKPAPRDSRATLSILPSVTDARELVLQMTAP